MIRIANAQGFWGDSLEAPLEQREPHGLGGARGKQRRARGRRMADRADVPRERVDVHVDGDRGGRRARVPPARRAGAGSAAFSTDWSQQRFDS